MNKPCVAYNFASVFYTLNNLRQRFYGGVYDSQPFTCSRSCFPIIKMLSLNLSALNKAIQQKQTHKLSTDTVGKDRQFPF